MSIDVNFMIGGGAGQGVQSVGFIPSKAFARGGYHVFADQDYESRLRSGVRGYLSVSFTGKKLPHLRNSYQPGKKARCEAED
jgi:hypothetical protein